MKGKVEGTLSLNGLHDNLLAALPQDNIISKEEINIRSINAIKTLFTAITPSGKRTKNLHLCFLHNGFGWYVLICGDVDAFDASVTDINRIASNISFLF